MDSKKQDLRVATLWEYQASLFGATIAALGAGALFPKLLESAAPYLVLIGVALHGWGMYRMHVRNL
jgi:hypothetical protein